MKDRFMRFGLTYDFRNPAGSGRSDQELYTELLDQIVLAEKLGYDEVWLTEHHFTDDGYNPSVLPMAAGDCRSHVHHPNWHVRARTPIPRSAARGRRRHLR